MKWVLAIFLGALTLISGCAFRAGAGEIAVDVGDVVVDVRPEHRGRTHLQHHHVRDGVRYCYYSNGVVTQRHPRYDCPLVY